MAEPKKMKAFEEWRDENFMGGRSYKADARVWRAALIWASKQSIVNVYVGDYIPKSIIEKELGINNETI